jgi:hypothetical protein
MTDCAAPAYGSGGAGSDNMLAIRCWVPAGDIVDAITEGACKYLHG